MCGIMRMNQLRNKEVSRRTGVVRELEQNREL